MDPTQEAKLSQNFPGDHYFNYEEPETNNQVIEPKLHKAVEVCSQQIEFSIKMIIAMMFMNKYGNVHTEIESLRPTSTPRTKLRTTTMSFQS